MESPNKFPNKPVREEQVNEARRGLLKGAFAFGVGAVAGNTLRGFEKTKQEELPTSSPEEQVGDNSWEEQNLGPLIKQLTKSPENLRIVAKALEKMIAKVAVCEEELRQINLLMKQLPSEGAEYETLVTEKLILESELDDRMKYINGYTQIISKFETMPVRDNNSQEHIQDSISQGQPDTYLTTYSNKQIM